MPQSRRSCSGNVDVAGAIPAVERAGVRCHFVEYDQPADPLASIRSSYAYLTGLTWLHTRSWRPGAPFIGCG